MYIVHSVDGTDGRNQLHDAPDQLHDHHRSRVEVVAAGREVEVVSDGRTVVDWFGSWTDGRRNANAERLRADQPAAETSVTVSSGTMAERNYLEAASEFFWCVHRANAGLCWPRLKPRCRSQD